MNHNAVNRLFFASAFALGLIAVVWVGAGFVGTSAIALAMTVAIGGVYLLGAQEVRRFRALTAGLAQALADVPQPLVHLSDWLGRVPPGLHNAVRTRIEGERGALPGLALTPYLIGLLVMLGMLGTFLGLVVTFRGAVFTLEGTADLQAIRSALAAPIKGLGLAFGTSVVGVATSAMLGLMSVISRRERMEVVRQLDAQITTVFHPFSLAHQRNETFKALQQQAGALPAVVDQLQALMAQMERRGQQLDEQLLERQALFHREAGVAYQELGQSVARSLNESLSASARIAGETLQPVVSNAMAAIASESTRLHERVGAAVQAQLDGISIRWDATATTVAQGWSAALQQHAHTTEQQAVGLERALGAFTSTFEQRSAALLASVHDTVSRSRAEQTVAEQHQQTAWKEALQAMATTLQGEWQQLGAQTLAQQQAVGQTLQQTATDWRSELAALRSDEATRFDAAVQRLGELQTSLNTQVATHLALLGAAIEAPIARLLETATEAPKAAAEVIAQLRREATQLGERDNLALRERTALMNNIGSLLQTVQHATGEQREAIESLVTSASAVLDQVGRQFAETVGAQAHRAQEVAAQVSGSAIELASLGEAFGHGVQLFAATNEKLIGSLQRIEEAVGQSMVRSDEQLAYYVAQAREVIDLSISSQQGIVDDLRRLRAAERAA
ncbi:DUF802 domain-containing protein [Hydrogenophaga sp. PBL-H3]|uniref:DUF802 domain-containing protein n=1 Tax=Hydrogenophaga sp. PBL-H3 TaxID=434010 RepID=UPI00131FA7C4|nr:DUF802 domain-containing protein [Hydrogenophaga sp. PBL-H3]QHE77406.1 DUF802 domain-containing protein [Hydrogenophaga sp. PBL-H3]QHE81830.1 DUF802 domain-containing protein [Hydrogenophaga sp. PBL-H3]